MSLEKLEFDKFSHDASLTGDGSKNNPLGINFNDITGLQPYNERLLFSAELSGVSSVELPTSKNHFERLRFVLGARNWKENGLESKEFGTETTAIHLNFMNGAGGNAYWVGTYGTWSDDRHLTVQKSKNIYGSYSNANITGNISWTADDVNCIKEIYGVNEEPRYFFIPLRAEGGLVSSNIDVGYSGDTATLTTIPESEVWKCSALNITGAELTGNDFMFGNSNVTAQAEFEHSRDLTLENGDHGVLSADKMSGFSGDVVTVDATTDEGWYFTGLNVTGATATGNQFMFVGENVTAEGLYTDQGYPITYLSDEHVHLSGDDIYIPGSEGITLDSGYDTYYRISGYDITGGSIVDGKLVPTGPCTIKAIEKVNYFTARGNFNQVTRGKENWGRGGTGQAYAYAYFTGGENCPLDYYTATYTSYNRGTTNVRTGSWDPTGSISGYSFNAVSTSIAYIEDITRWAGGFCRLQVNNANFGGGSWPTNRYNCTCTATGTTTTIGNVRYYLSGSNRAGYQLINSCLITTGNNGWTATGIAP